MTIRITNIATPCEDASIPAAYRCVDSFIANRARDGDRITITAAATQGTTDISSQITWSCADLLGDAIYSGTCEPETGTGATFSFVPKPPDALDGRSAPLSYQVMARVTVNVTAYEDVKIIRQDYLDELRQEYEDLPQRESRERIAFDRDTAVHNGLLGTASESARHDNWHILRSLNVHAQDSMTRYTNTYGGNLQIISGYRCPVGNEQLVSSGAARTSNHQYGEAFDFDQGDNNQQMSQQNYNAFRAALAAGAGGDTYLQGSNGNRYYWDNRNGIGTPSWPAPDGVTYTKGHAAW